jgi:hypothetical protein
MGAVKSNILFAPELRAPEPLIIFGVATIAASYLLDILSAIFYINPL